ncbi:sulfurtransferase TusA family protein [Candidatus Bipolaricaulota bacterium]|nr:sulfurtransferase TusA family protein [Candidatus Bipolaricaulota bacterium]
MTEQERELVVDCRGETCPVPLVEVRKAVRRGRPGDVVTVLGTHPASRKEIPMAVRALGLTVESDEGVDTDWIVRIRL